MRAMILAAGLGTRLRPLTHKRPKALVEVAGRTLLEITLTRLRDFGITDVIINTHHFADMMADYLRKNTNFGMNIEISREETLLDTGGGLKKAAFFFETGLRAEPFVLHNVDVISNLDIGRMLQSHNDRSALATLAVQNRRTSRYLLFDDGGCLSGRKSAEDVPKPTLPPGLHPLAFCGIHIISPHLLPKMTEQGTFSIIDTYLRLAAAGDKILSFRADGYDWRDLGRLENIEHANKEFEQKRSAF
jgi:NDP-sugar pyrophosphorylase family protein